MRRYKDLRLHVGLDEVYLLLHYDFKAFAYNTPFDAPNFGFKEASEFAASALGGDGGYFDRIFLFHFLWGNEEATELFRIAGRLSKFVKGFVEESRRSGRAALPLQEIALEC